MCISGVYRYPFRHFFTYFFAPIHHARVLRVNIDADELMSLVIGSLNDTSCGDSPNCSGNTHSILVCEK